MNKKIKINLDLDDVLNNLSLHWKQTHYQSTGENLPFNTWNVGENSQYGERVYEHLTAPNFFYNCDRKHGANKLIDYLQNNQYLFDTKIVSMCHYEKGSSNYESIKLQKIQWLHDKFKEASIVSNFHLVNETKSGYLCDIIVDDYAKNLNEVKKKNVLKLLFSAPHNKDVDLKHLQKVFGGYYVRVNNHDEVIEILKDVSFEGSVENYINKHKK
jgi:hypothetical protein